jgi:para-aminobenzoate synthetase component 1
MWSDGTTPERLRALTAALHSVLPAPAPRASTGRQGIAGSASVDQVADLLNRDPGFCWLNGSDGTRLLAHPLATVSYFDGAAEVTGPGGTRHIEGRAFEILESMLEAWGGPSGAMLAGYLSYDLAAELEDLGESPRSAFAFPAFWFGLFDSALSVEDGAWSVTWTDAWRARPGWVEEAVRGAALQRPDSNAGLEADCGLISRPDRCAFEASVERIVRIIHAGDIFQTNLCRCVETRLRQGLEWDLYKRMRAISPARYETFLRLNEGQAVLSISPEQFLKLDAGMVESSPIKGTRPRASSPEADTALAQELLESEKDRAELSMIVDVVRNDLARVCETGSVRVARHAELMTLPTLHHSYSTVTGRLRQDRGPVDLLRAAFPAASISGAPKIEAMRVAQREEGQRRGPAMGAIGWISMDRRLEFSVAIRTAFLTEGRVRYYGGCGITADSVPSDEFAESRHKIRAFVRALGAESDPNW